MGVDTISIWCFIIPLALIIVSIVALRVEQNQPKVITLEVKNPMIQTDVPKNELRKGPESWKPEDLIGPISQKPPGPPSFFRKLFSAKGRISGGEWFLISLLAGGLPAITAVIAYSMVGWSVMEFIGTMVEHVANGYPVDEVFKDLVHIFPGLGMATLVSLLGLIGATWVGWCADIRRFHDMGRSGNNTLWRFTFGFPYVGQLIMLVYFCALAFTRADQFDNEYGPGERGLLPVYTAAPQPQVVVVSPQPAPVSNQALDMAKLRLASGEITVKEYLEMVNHLAREG